MRETGKFMRDGGNQTIDIFGLRHVFDPTRQIGRRYMGRDAHSIKPRIMKGLRYTGRRFHLGNRITHNEAKSGLTTDIQGFDRI